MIIEPYGERAVYDGVNVSALRLKFNSLPMSFDVYVELEYKLKLQPTIWQQTINPVLTKWAADNYGFGTHLAVVIRDSGCLVVGFHHQDQCDDFLKEIPKLLLLCKLAHSG